MSRLSASLFCVVFYTVVLCASAQSEDPEIRIVQTAQGPVKGYRDQDDDVYTFFGIPYATAPTGKDRYKAPLPGPSWLTPFDAKSDSIICPQFIIPVFKDMYSDNDMMENCLIANVYVPNTTEKNLPVMVLIHGGGFEVGNGNMLKPMKLIRSSNIIVVTFNYRLGIHGFLCLGTEAVPGNAGMKDQVALLRWMNKNIANFGGNPNDVTISGASAGAASVDLLMVSPLAKGLFHKVIAESGGGLGTYAVQTDPLKVAQRFAKKHVTDYIDDVFALEEFYRSASFETIISESFMQDLEGYIFTPCLEVDYGQEIFLSDSPYNILKSGEYEKLPILYGFADREGLFRLGIFDTLKNLMNENFSAHLPHNLKFSNKEEKEKMANVLKSFYFGDKKVSEDTVLPYVDFFSDMNFGYPILKAIEWHVKNGHNKVFLYEYNYVDDSTPLIPHTDKKGAMHCAQTMAVLDGTSFANRTEIDSELPNDLKQHKHVMRQLWGNFIKTGAPVPEGSSLPVWPPVGEDGSPHMSLGRTLELRGPLMLDRMRIWDSVYQRHFRVPKPPNAFGFSAHEEL